MSNKDRTLLRSNELVVHNVSGETVPALSFARLTAYDKTNQHFNISKPYYDNMPAHKIVIIPEAIANDAIGIATITGIGVVRKTGGETIAAGDFVSTDENQWTAIEKEIGAFVVLTVSDNYLVVTRMYEHRTRMARTTEVSPASDHITCNIVDKDGNEIFSGDGAGVDVYCRVAGGNNLNQALPYLYNDSYIFVEYLQDAWWCTTVFTSCSVVA